MPYRICKTFEIESGHMLSKHPDLCKFPHGHSRKVEFVLEADELDGNEMVCDFKSLKEAMSQFLKMWDHALCVNTKDPQHDILKKAYGDRIISFENLDPTTEVMARSVHGELKRSLAAYASNPAAKYPLRPCVRIVRVRVWETSSSWAEFSEAATD
jgi:6-pyruvoyltetrahydropterin/6-carboxytetrahydropterin synthase